MEAALLERMYFCKVGSGYVEPPRVDGDLLRQRLDWFSRSVREQMSSFTPVCLNDFVEMYKGPKKATYARAVESLQHTPVRRRDGETSAFVKREKCNTSKAPRAIQTRDPRYHASVGRFFKPVEKRVYRAIASAMDASTIVSKGLNLDEVGELIHSKWSAFNHPVALGLDATKFDMHVSPEMLEWEHSFYKSIFRGNKAEKARFARLLRWQVNNRGKSFCVDGKVKYSVHGRRMSGDMNTSLGNCLIMCAMIFSYALERGVRIDLLNNGDDCVVFMEAEDLSRFTVGLDKWFLEMGFRMTSEAPVYAMEAIEFCQMHPVQVGGGWRMVRNPRTALEKDTMCTIMVNDHEYLSWLAGVAQCGLAACSGVPVMQAFYESLSATSRVPVEQRLVEDTGMRRLTERMSVVHREVTEEARYSFWLAFGVSPDDQRAMEADMAHVRSTRPLEHFVGTLWPIDAKPITTRPRYEV